MSRLEAALKRLNDAPGGRAKRRLACEMAYAREVSEALSGKYEGLLLCAARAAEEAVREDGALTDARALEVESTLLPMQGDCKRYRLLLCGHAHIDMNWMWRYDETVQITLDTFQTVLDLMRDFPGFTFSQSQASVYRIAEQYDPELLEAIARRVREGRWEVTASTWVEADRNMPSSESVARHHLYTKRYLTELLGAQLALTLDYEPDTFGHHQNTPELLAQAGVKYYYHCRGYDGQTLYRWRSPSGAEVIAYREPFWYLGAVDEDIAAGVPAFCEKFGMPCALRVYGVGDHGGGPTRRDLERIVEMQSWPIFADVRFGKYAEFFEAAEASRERLPVVARELNPVFVGCYTTQTRIKKGNRCAERMLGEAEAFSALTHMALGAPYRARQFEARWRDVLFNQFHDILPGSGVIDTREYAMGLYQEVYATANAARRTALRALADRIDTGAFAAAEVERGAVSQGAGVGFGVERGMDLAQMERSYGPVRLAHLFNACAFDREEVAEWTLWDYQGDANRLAVRDEAGREVAHQVIGGGKDQYWGHHFLRLLMKVSVPALGYATYSISELPEERARAVEAAREPNGPVVERGSAWWIENELLSAELLQDARVGGIAVTDKRSGEVYVIEGFQFVREDASRGMTAWIMGEAMSEQAIWAGMKVKRGLHGPLCDELIVSAPLGESSRLEYKLTLRAGSDLLDISATVHWLEAGGNGCLPQLRFDLMTDDIACNRFLYDVPGGVLMRDACAFDLPGRRFIAAGDLMLLSDSKYGYRGSTGRMGVTLIRSSVDPDPYPELGVHSFRLGVAFLNGARDAAQLMRRAQAFESALTGVSGARRTGNLPARGALLRVESGEVELTAIKRAEDGDSLILRGVELCGGQVPVVLSLEGLCEAGCLRVARARFADAHEQPLVGAQGEPSHGDRSLRFVPRPFGAFTLRVDLEREADKTP